MERISLPPTLIYNLRRLFAKLKAAGWLETGKCKPHRRKTRPSIVNWRILRAKMCAVSAGISRNPNAINGPTLSTAGFIAGQIPDDYRITIHFE